MHIVQHHLNETWSCSNEWKFRAMWNVKPSSHSNGVIITTTTVNQVITKIIKDEGLRFLL
jgi:hypothetical protein